MEFQNDNNCYNILCLTFITENSVLNFLSMAFTSLEIGLIKVDICNNIDAT